MFIAVDDTYGPQTETASKYVSGQRRTHVAVIFPDSDVDELRYAISECLKGVNSLGVLVDEFHFSDIYNRRNGWEAAPELKNLDVIAAFAQIYSAAKWPVVVQTVDDRTFADHKIDLSTIKTDVIDLSKREHVSFHMLMKLGLTEFLTGTTEDVRLVVDEGIGRNGQKIDPVILPAYCRKISGSYASSANEPLLQIADFLAFSINRCTHLAMKTKRSELDTWFLKLVGSMNINSPQLEYKILPENFDVSDFDELHRTDRAAKGIE